MDSEKTIREELLGLLGGGNAHMDFDEAITRFPIKAANSYLPNSDYTPWRLLEHMRIAQWDILEFIRNPKHVSPPWPEGYWPREGEKADGKKWKNSVSRFRKDLSAMKRIIRGPKTKLLAPIAHAPGYTVFREVLTLADHNAYHLGEFAMMREIMRNWAEKK